MIMIIVRPFPDHKPLPLLVDQVITILHDDGSGWVFGHEVGTPDVQGFFPKNYTAPRDEAEAAAAGKRAEEDIRGEQTDNNNNI